MVLCQLPKDGLHFLQEPGDEKCKAFETADLSI